MIKSQIEALDAQYPNAIPVFGGALFAAKYVHENFNLDKFIMCLSNAIYNAKFYNWHESPAKTAQRFCNLCGIDPFLIETYIGTSFNEIWKEA